MNRVELVFRSVGERTAELSLELAKRHIRPTRTHVVEHVTPFSRVVDRLLSIDHDCDYVVHLDADCLVLESMEAFLQDNQFPYVDSFVHDRFRGRVHCGVHITRMDVLREMRRVPPPPSDLAYVLRPESRRRTAALQRLGFGKAFRSFHTLHDYGQWHAHIFAKYAQRELRSRTPMQRAKLQAAMNQWEDGPEFAVARLGISHAQRHVDQTASCPAVHEYIRRLPNIAEQELRTVSLPPQEPLAMPEVERASDEAKRTRRGGARHKVFGIGLSRTGTRSLTASLNVLGYDVVHYPLDERTFRDLAEARFDLGLLDHYDGVTDITVAPYYAHLHRRYPDAKFILTVREKGSWLRSCRNHWRGRDAFAPSHTSEQQTHMKIRRLLRAAVYGCYTFDEERFSWVYDEHVERVRRYFSDFPGSLLELDIVGGQEWAPLCSFLDTPHPGLPFPHKGGELSRKIAQLDDDID